MHKKARCNSGKHPVHGQKYYQYTAFDKCTRFCFREIYDEHSTYSLLEFLKKLINAFLFPNREIQTDNGTERTNALLVKKAPDAF